MSNSRSFGGGLTAPSRPYADTPKGCKHGEGHDLALSAGEALTPIEAYRECPCCGARLWMSLPSVGAILDAAYRLGHCDVPDLGVDLTRREQQVLNVLHGAPYPLRHGQIAALVWSDPDRGHDVRSTLYRLRAKLRGSGWAIPFPPTGKGVCLVRAQSTALAA